MKARIRKLALLVVSVAGALLLAELGLRLFAPEPLSGSYRVATDTGLLINRSEGSARHQLGDRVVRYRFFPPGLRGQPLDPARETVLCLGDSFTFGYLLNWEDTHVARLQALADRAFGPRYRFVVGAAAGWGTAEMLAYVEELGEEVDPDVVLVFLNHDDVGRAARHGLYVLAEQEGLELERRRVARSDVKRGLNAVPGYRWLVEHSHLLHLARRRFVAATSPPREPGPAARRGGLSEEDCLRLARALFRRLHAWCEAHDARLLVTTTGWHLPAEDPAEFEPTRAFLAEAPAFFAELGVPFHDVSPAMLAAMGQNHAPYAIPGDHHPNETGAALTAQLVFEELLRAQLE